MPHDPVRPARWLARSIVAGLAAVTVGGGICTTLYLQLPGAERLDWSVHFGHIGAYILFTGLCVGTAIGAGMAWAVGRRGARQGASLGRLVLGATLGTLVGGIIPAVVGIAYFGSLCAPYAGTANLLLSILAAATTYVVLWAPVLDDRAAALPRPHRIGIASLSATLAATSMAALGWTLATVLDVLPSLSWMQHTAREIGLVPFAAWAGLFVCGWIGLYMGLATWLDLTLSLAWRRFARGH